ncbi:putative reverse transcriptase zinc-binding domain-containing protein [Helianthus anomalus]
MLLDRIPTKKALQRRNIDCGSPVCNFCEDQEESVDHLFTGCCLANGVWHGIANWMKMPTFFFFSVHDILQASSWPARKKMARNEKIFQEVNRNVVQLVAEIKALSYVWFSSRSKKGVMGWKDWQKFDFDVGRYPRHIISLFFRLLYPWYWPSSCWNFVWSCIFC